MTLAGRATYHHGNLRQALIDAARRLIGERGADGFSLREAARDLGVTAAATYRHFHDKAELLNAVAAQGSQSFCDALERGMAGVQGPVQRFRALGKSYVEFARERPAEFSVIFGYSAAPGVDRSPRSVVAATVRELKAAGFSRHDDGGAVLAAWSTLHGLAGLAAAGTPISEPEIEVVLDALLAGLRQPS